MDKMTCRLALLIVLFLPLATYAQPDDWEYWTSIKAEIETVKDVNLELEQEFRFDRSASRLNQQIYNLGLEYDIDKHFKFSAFYRHKDKRKDSENQLYAAGYYSKDVWELEFTYRLKYQKKFPQNEPENDRVRNRLEVKLEESKAFRPYFSFEVFYHVFSDSDRFNETRYVAGLEINLNKNNKFDIYLMIFREFNIPKPNTSNVIGMNYSMEF